MRRDITELGSIRRSVFDWHFEIFAAPALIRAFYTVWTVVVLGVGTVAVGAALFQYFQGPGFEALALVLGMLVAIPLVTAVLWVLGRLYAEVAIVLFRIAGDLSYLAERDGANPSRPTQARLSESTEPR